MRCIPTVAQTLTLISSGQRLPASGEVGDTLGHAGRAKRMRKGPQRAHRRSKDVERVCRRRHAALQATYQRLGPALRRRHRRACHFPVLKHKYTAVTAPSNP